MFNCFFFFFFLSDDFTLSPLGVPPDSPASEFASVRFHSYEFIEVPVLATLKKNIKLKNVICVLINFFTRMLLQLKVATFFTVCFVQNYQGCQFEWVALNTQKHVSVVVVCD